MALVDDLLANVGTYVGIDTDPQSGSGGAARMVVTALPAGVGVALDYEVFTPDKADRIRPHLEHTMIGRDGGGGTVMVIAHSHGDSIAIMRETEPGVFELGSEPSPFPMKVVVAVPGPGRIRHSWWYGRPGDEPIERDVAELTRVD